MTQAGTGYAKPIACLTVMGPGVGYFNVLLHSFPFELTRVNIEGVKAPTHLMLKVYHLLSKINSGIFLPMFAAFEERTGWYFLR